MSMGKYIAAPLARALGIRYNAHPTITPIHLLYPTSTTILGPSQDVENSSSRRNSRQSGVTDDMPQRTVYLLTLSDDGSPDIVGNYINLPPPTEPYTLRFSIEGASSICREGSLWVNVPVAGEEFDRKKFRKFELSPHFNRNIYIDITIDRPGAFAFYTTYAPLPKFSASTSSGDSKPQPTQTPTHYFTVPPNLTINGQPLPLDSLSVLSVVSKWLGSVDKWEPHLSYISRKGYNMVHFTPIQQRGDSNSPYSLRNQLVFDPEAFPNGLQDVENVVARMEKEFGILSLTDVVWNHTAPESEWLQEHPNSGYNLITAPWLESAYVLDTALLEFGLKLESLDLPTDLKTTDDVLLVMEGIKKHVIPEIALWEFYAIDVKRDSALAVEAWKAGKGKEGLAGYTTDLSIFHKAALVVKAGLRGADRLGERFRRNVDPEAGAAYLYSAVGEPSGVQEAEALEAITKVLDELNLPFYKEYDADLAEILEQIFNRIKYLKIDAHGPLQGPVKEGAPLVETYFCRLPKNSTTEKHPEGALYLAVNGWIWNANPLIDFAGPNSRAYLRREVISWGDCVKLRYGKGPEDSPFLWQHMKTYTELMAKCFHGFRIDNCHSTPLVVAEYLLDAARTVRKDLYVMAELFTGNENMDKVYVERLALASLIREAMQAWGTGELSRLVHKHGGKPIGSFEPESGTGFLGVGKDAAELIKIVTGSPIHALFMDCTHDNEPPAQKREAKDTLPNGALVAMCDCAVGSVYGYDEVYPKLLDVVNEKRFYSPPPPPADANASAAEKEAAGLDGVAKIKRILNRIHEKMTKEGYEEMHVHHENEYITVHRVKPGVNKGYFLIAHTAMKGSTGDHRGDIKPISLPGSKVKLIGGWALKVEDTEEDKKAVIEAQDLLTGLPSKVEELVMDEVKEDFKAGEVGVVSTITVPKHFPPGSIALYETWIPGSASSEQSAGENVYDLDDFLVSEAKEAVSKLNLFDLNFLLYKCEAEERDSTGGKDGTYNVPGVGNLVYAGIQGWWSVMQGVVEKNDLGHPLCQHLRDGTWSLGYIIGRIKREIEDKYDGDEGKAARLSPVKEWFTKRLERIERVPSWLRPRCFALVVGEIYIRSIERATDLMGGCLVEQGSSGDKKAGFLRELALVGVQVTGINKSTSLWPDKPVAAMAAGLPHFSYDYMRCWGRDIFISLRGLYLATGRYSEAKEHILAFASVMKHGMIPNLLDAGRKPRYNARDSIWFWLQCVQDYAKMVPHGTDILNESVKRRFLPYDDEWFGVDDSRAYSRSSTIAEVIQEALQRHAGGMAFREANAGTGLDSNMRDEGFWIQNGVKDWNRPFVSGGNKWNCGTWMDKNGESDKAGSKGVPGSPRDGAAIEITGLLYSTLRWVVELNKRGLYQWDSVQISTETKETISLQEWADRIQRNFEKCYYVPLDDDQDKEYVIKKHFVLTRGIYKDLFGSSVLVGARDGDQQEGREDYRFRPNQFIAMVVAPDLFDPNHALGAIEIADTVLRGPVGMATLAPDDINYRPYYINSEDSGDFLTSKGRNYHQGPEWVWPTGFFLRAMLKFDLQRKSTREERVETYQQITRRLGECKKHIRDSVWRGLTELTQKNGEICNDSCPTQAWSASCLIDLFYDCDKLHQEWERNEEVS